MRRLIRGLAVAAGVGCGPEEVGEPSACDPSGGVLCTWLGRAGTPYFDSERHHRLAVVGLHPLDGLWGPDGWFYYLDYADRRVRRVGALGLVETVVGTGFDGRGPEGPADEFHVWLPSSLAFHPSDDSILYIADATANSIYVVNLEGGIASYKYGFLTRGFEGDGGRASEALFERPSSIHFDDSNNMYIADQYNYVIRLIDSNEVIETFAGKVETRLVDHDWRPDTPAVEVTRGWPGYFGDGGLASEARFFVRRDTDLGPKIKIKVRNDFIYLVDSDNHMIRKINLFTKIIDNVAGSVELGADPYASVPGDPVNLGSGFEDGPADRARFNRPRDLDVAADGTIYVADTDNHCVRRIRDGIVDTIAGVCGEPGFDGDGLPATASRLSWPNGVALSPDGTRLMIADTYNHVFRVVGL